MRSEVCVLVNGVVQWRFHPQRIDEAAGQLLTSRIPQYPPLPVGATLLLDCQPLGEVASVKKASFSRWSVTYTPAAEVASREEPTHTPIEALRAHLDPRIFEAIRPLAETVEALQEQDDTALREIDGIGPKRLREIREACAKALTSPPAASIAREISPGSEGASSKLEDVSVRTEEAKE